MSREESTQYAFDAYCKRLVKNGAIDIHREYARQEKREVVFSELTNRELSCLQYMDYYALEQTTFRVLYTTIKIADVRLSRALEDLSQERREVILLSYLLDMKDREIAEQLGLSLSTVQYRRSSTLEKLRKIMEGFKNG